MREPRRLLRKIKQPTEGVPNKEIRRSLVDGSHRARAQPALGEVVRAEVRQPGPRLALNGDEGSTGAARQW